jgi:cytochrome c oxidase subunit 4
MAGSEAGHAHTNYMAIFWWLFALTIVEVAVPFAITAQIPKVFLLVSLAVGKAALVGLYFMHLRFEVRTLGIIALTPMLLCAFLLFMLVPDSTWRVITG